VTVRAEEIPHQIGRAAYADARKHAAVLYQRVTQDIRQLRGCLAADYPIVFGFSVYTSFESDAVAESGRVPMPKLKEKMVWGTSWGRLAGYFTIAV
jgi:C1A family cysteine protease